MHEWEPPSRTFARRLREIREARRPPITQKELARRLSLLRPAIGDNIESLQVLISRTERGQRKPTVDDLIAFATALEVAPAELLDPNITIDEHGAHVHERPTLGFWGETEDAFERHLDEQRTKLEELRREAEQALRLERDFQEYLRRKEAEDSGRDR